MFFGLNSDVQPEKITSDLRFYEINTCSISLIDFLIENPNVIYQDHYKIRFNDYSAMKCFGTLTGIDQINDVFYISIGTSAYLNLFIQSSFWLLIISLIKKSRNFQISAVSLISSVLTSLLLVFMVYSEERLYVKNIYFHDFNEVRYFLQLFLTILIVSLFSYYFMYSRIDNLGNYFPLLFLIIGVYSGLNFNFFSIGIVFFGFQRILKEKKIFINKYYLIFLILVWSNNAYNKEYFVDPDKIRGFTSSIFTSQNLIFYSIFFIVFINGLISIFNNQNNFNIEYYFKNSLYSATLVLVAGLVGSGFPVMNFLSYYFFGLNKYGINRSNLFELNQWGERLAWRGHFPSAETIGEFYGIVILIYVYLIFFKKILFSYRDFLLICVVATGLLLSNNRAAILSIILCVTVLVARQNLVKKYSKYILGFFLIGISTFLIGVNNLNYSFQFISESILNNAIFYSVGENYSSSINYLLGQRNSESFIYSLFSLLSVFGFYVNRSELWGIFFSRHSPELQEVVLGSGLFNYGQLYGEIAINPTKSFLLPHSSVLSFYMFIGVINILFLLYILFTKIFLKIRHSDDIFIYLSIFVFLNLLKSDSVLYLSSFINYFFYFYYAHKLKKSYI